jgi:hypothetical protein
MGNQTGLLTSHSTMEMLEEFYLDPKVLSAVEQGAINGVKNNPNTNHRVTQQGDTRG